nr:capsid protein [Cressdnaviricota sp.]
MAYLKRAVKRVAKKAYRAVKRAAKKRYVTKTGKGIRVSQVVKDVAMLKRMVNAEKKQLQYKSLATSPPQVGQVNGNASGHFIMDITPIIAEGVASYQRTGGSVKWNSSYLEFMFNKNTAGGQAQTFIIEFWKVNNQPYTATQLQNGTLISDLFEPNGYVTNSSGGAVSIYDSVASRDQDTFKNFRRIGYRKVYFPMAQMASTPMVKLVKIPLKMGHHIKYQSYQTGDTNILASGQVIMTVRADNGNSSSTTACTNLGVPVTAVNTGATFQYSFTHYFYDN